MTAAGWAGVALLGGAGAVARHEAARLGARTRAGRRFPAGTLGVNLAGALALGLLAGAGAHGTLLLVVGGGLLGALTTFSTWMLEVRELAGAGRRGAAAAYLAGPAAAGLALAALGRVIGEALA